MTEPTTYNPNEASTSEADLNKYYCEQAKHIIRIERQALDELVTHIDHQFSTAVHLLARCKHKIITLGIGKSGHIAKKIAATLASTGSPAFFVHPSEAKHGDLGMITAHDVVIATSYSGETSEILELITPLQHMKVPLISITGHPQSSLARSSCAHLNVKINQEACHLGLAPTASTTACLAMGDALAITLSHTKNFTPQAFARCHPGGHLGFQLKKIAPPLMRTGAALPIVYTHTLLKDTLIEMTRKGLGLTAIVNQQHIMMGVFTDGDLRRTLNQNLDLQTTTVDQVMTKHGKTILQDTLIHEALHIMENHRITALMVVNDQQQPIGAVQMHDLLQHQSPH